MSVLQKICNDKQEHIAFKKGQLSLADIKAKSKDCAPTRSFKIKLSDQRQKGVALIAEIKKASPSRGIIRADFDPVKIADAYQNAGATCLSVLTDIPYFQGEDRYVQAVRDVVELPVLRKDFMIDPYQIYESRVLGADCILLIMAALEDNQAEDLYGIASELGMDVLTEVHDEEELHRATAINAQMIGINNRNLKTLEVTLQTSIELAQKMPESVLRISESGIYTNNDIKMLTEKGFHGFLVGESLMKQDDIETAVRTLIEG